MSMKVPGQEDVGRAVTLIGNLGSGAKYRGAIRALTPTTVVIDAMEIDIGNGWESLDPKRSGGTERQQVRGALIIEEEEQSAEKVATVDG